MDLNHQVVNWILTYIPYNSVLVLRETGTTARDGIGLGKLYFQRLAAAAYRIPCDVVLVNENKNKTRFYLLQEAQLYAKS